MIRGMPSINASDAGKRQMNASKAFSTRQPAKPQTRPLSGVGCFLLRRGRTDFQDARSSIADDQSGSRSRALLNAQREQLWQIKNGKAGLHIRAVRTGGVPAVL